MNKKKNIRILLYSCNGMGMGHITRSIAIAHKLKKLTESANYTPEIFMMTSSRASHVADYEGFVTFKVPSWKNVVLHLPEYVDEYKYTKGRDISINIMQKINPDIIVMDNAPWGYLNEFKDSDILSKTKAKSFVFRERKESRIDENFLAGMQLYDSIIIPNENNPNLEILNFHKKKIHYVGNIIIRDRNELMERNHVQKLYDLDPEKITIYLTAGGGGDKNHKSTIDILVDATAGNDVQIVVGLGSLYHGHIPTFNGKARPIIYYPMIDLYKGFDITVSAAGYNTVSELLYSGTASILYPQPRNVDDQDGRVKKISDTGAAIGLKRNFSIDDVLNAIKILKDETLRKEISFRAQNLIKYNGAWSAAYNILKPLLPDSSLRTVKNILPKECIIND
jgi:predicted glycosyltransferase